MSEAEFTAEIKIGSPVKPFSVAAFTVVVVAILISASLSGFFSFEEGSEEEPEYEHWLPDVEDRSNKFYQDDDVFSRVSWNGSFGVDAVRSIYVPVPAIVASDGGAGVTGGAEVHMGLWLPVIEGCDMDAAEVPEECQVPVIAEIGPYYDDGDVDALTPAWPVPD